MPSPESLLQRLLDHEVRFVIVGGYAAVAHGASLVTQDLDICCPFTAGNLLRLQAAVSDLRPAHRMTPQRIPLKLTAASCRGLKNLYLATDLGPLDCLCRILGVGDYKAARAASRRVRIGRHWCRILDIQPLIIAKLAMGRPRDIEAVRQLRAIRKEVLKPARQRPRH